MIETNIKDGIISGREGGGKKKTIIPPTCTMNITTEELCYLDMLRYTLLTSEYHHYH